MKPTFIRCDRPDLLAFEEVSRRLGLRTRLPVGRREVAIEEIIGSVGRAADFDGCFRPQTGKLRRAIADRAADPVVVDMPISLLQVDHAYFVEDGHKRLSIAIAAGRKAVDAYNYDAMAAAFDRALAIALRSPSGPSLPD